MTSPLRATLLLSIATCLVISAARSHAAEPKPATIEQIKKELAEKKALLVDVRELEEWNAGHIDKATLLPMSVLETLDAESLAKKLPKSMKVYTYCRAGHRAGLAADRLQELGYQVEPAVQGAYEKLLGAGFKKAPDEKPVAEGR